MGFDIHTKLYDESERDHEKSAEYIDTLMEEFAASPEARPLLDAGRNVHYAATMMRFGLDYIGVSPAELSRANVREIVFELFPRKLSTEAKNAAAIVEELNAFWRFVGRQYGLRQAAAIVADLDSPAADQLRSDLADPSKYGMAKSFFMHGLQAGFDMTTQEGINQAMLAYNSSLARNPPLPMPVPMPLGLPLDSQEMFSSMPRAGEKSPRAKADERRNARKRQREARKRNRK